MSWALRWPWRVFAVISWCRCRCFNESRLVKLMLSGAYRNFSCGVVLEDTGRGSDWYRACYYCQRGFYLEYVCATMRDFNVRLIAIVFFHNKRVRFAEMDSVDIGRESFHNWVCYLWLLNFQQFQCASMNRAPSLASFYCFAGCYLLSSVVQRTHRNLCYSVNSCTITVFPLLLDTRDKMCEILQSFWACRVIWGCLNFQMFVLTDYGVQLASTLHLLWPRNKNYAFCLVCSFSHLTTVIVIPSQF